jgi:iron complex outermembrane recepter protein
VTTINNAINASVGLTPANGLRGPAPFPTDSGVGATTGAFSVCSVLAASAAGFNAAVPSALISVVDGVGVSIKGNKLPQAPNFKFSVGLQKEIEFGNGMSLVPRVDLTYTGDSYGNIFNGRINKVPGYEQVNAQIQLNGGSDRWFVRGFIQNVFNSNAVTGLYLTDQSSGLFTNIFTLEPRRYGVSAGFKF